VAEGLLGQMEVLQVQDEVLDEGVDALEAERRENRQRKSIEIDRIKRGFLLVSRVQVWINYKLLLFILDQICLLL